MQERAAGRVALVAGASGLVGREILAAILADDTYVAVHGVGRRALATTHPKLTFHVLDFAALPVLPAVDDVFIALGTTIKVAGTREPIAAASGWRSATAAVAVAQAPLYKGLAILARHEERTTLHVCFLP